MVTLDEIYKADRLREEWLQLGGELILGPQGLPVARMTQEDVEARNAAIEASEGGRPFNATTYGEQHLHDPWTWIQLFRTNFTANSPGAVDRPDTPESFRAIRLSHELRTRRG